MTEEQIEFEKRKGALITEVMSNLFEAEVEKYVKDGDWKTFEELDAWLDSSLRSHDEVQRQIREYFETKIDE